MVLSRSLVEYSSHPGLVHFKRLIGMHPGADEIFWSTLVFNIPGYTQKLSRQGWYMRWNPYGWGHSWEPVGGSAPGVSARGQSGGGRNLAPKWTVSARMLTTVGASVLSLRGARF